MGAAFAGPARVARVREGAEVKHPRKRWLLVLSLAVWSGTIVQPWPANAGPASDVTEQFEGPGIVRSTKPNPNASHFVLQGVSVNGVCRFTFETAGVATRGTTGGIRYSQIAYDPRTCRSLIEVTAISRVSEGAPAVEAEEAGGGAGGEDASGGPQSNSTPQVLCPFENPYRDYQHTYTKDACVHSWFSDVVGIHVNDLTNEVQWNPGGGCANNGWSYASWYAKWLSETGWEMESNTFSPSFSCTAVISKNNTRFENPIFCALIRVATWYDPQRITGKANGTYVVSGAWGSDQGTFCPVPLFFNQEVYP